MNPLVEIEHRLQELIVSLRARLLLNQHRNDGDTGRNIRFLSSPSPSAPPPSESASGPEPSIIPASSPSLVPISSPTSDWDNPEPDSRAGEREDVTLGNGSTKLLTNNGTKGYFQWPPGMRIGTKTADTDNDLLPQAYGLDQESLSDGSDHVLPEYGPQRDLRITLKMEISYTDHSHLIGCRGLTIRKVMDDTGCHIHFPDSNRMSKEHKSNQVTIAGITARAVETARSRVRELTPVIFQFNVPILYSPSDIRMSPEACKNFFDEIQKTHKVQVTLQPTNKFHESTFSVKGCEVDSLQIKESIIKIVHYFAPSIPLSGILMQSTMEISPTQHAFVRAANDSNIRAIIMNTGAKIIFPDLSDPNVHQLKRSRVYIVGEINSVYFARQQLIGSLPLRMMFNLTDDFELDLDSVRQVGFDLNVFGKMISQQSRGGTSSPGSSPPGPGSGLNRTIQLIAAERNAGNIFEARRRILGGTEPTILANIPPAYILRSIVPQGHLPSLPPPPRVPFFVPPRVPSPSMIPSRNQIGSSDSRPPPGMMGHCLHYPPPGFAGRISPNIPPYYGLPIHLRPPGFERSNPNPFPVQPKLKQMEFQEHDEFWVMQALYKAKLAGLPESADWSGYGFDKPPSRPRGPWSALKSPAGNYSGVLKDLNNNSIWTEEEGADKLFKLAMGHETTGSKPLDNLSFAGDASTPDLRCLFIKNGLEKYIDGFVSEEVDLEAFSTLSATDLRSLGVSSYPARKKMLQLILQLRPTPEATQSKELGN